jgi:transposase-like protein
MTPMPARTPASTQHTQKPPCPHCGKPYRTLLNRNYRLRIDGSIKQSIPMGSQWRCMACGKTYTTEDE